MVPFHLTEEASEESHSDLEQVTRSVFDPQHREQAADPQIRARIGSLVSPEYFGLAPAFFRDKVVLDAGCGSNAHATYAFLEHGARHVHAIDLGEDWMDCARDELGVFEGRFSVGSEDVLALTFESDTFDFVHCAGVLHHVRDPRAGFAELARVTAPRGSTFVTVMATGNGIVYPWVNLLRARYRSDPAFRAGVDEFNVDMLRQAVDWLLASKDEFEPSSDQEREFLRGLLDADLVITIKDRIQAPTYHDFAFTEADVREWFQDAGYVDVRRVTRYPKGIRNVRRFLAPLFYHYEHPLARLLFGDGHVQMIGRKPGVDPAAGSASLPMAGG